EQLAENLGRHLRGGEVIELASDLGGGKTTFVRGLARGAGSPDRVGSPTFTISKTYNAPRFEIHHFDFYRLQQADLAAYELHDLLNDPQIVIVVEWAAVIEHVLPEQRLSVIIERTSADARAITLRYTEALQYLVEEL
ncbi:MAG TPA: tRNA (adenosine(37)-N6)-threonylcarbamoyltransferase complex ATPase subunit type 1 TsaE, partial [Hymenobacter sp.]